MKRVVLLVRCFFAGHVYDFAAVLPGRPYGAAVARFTCCRCGKERFER